MTNSIKGGFTPSRNRGGRPNSGGLEAYPIANSYNITLGHGDPVKVSAGFLVQADNNKRVVGVFQGCYYIDPTTKQPRNLNYFPANTSSGGLLLGYDSPIGFVSDQAGTYVAEVNSSISAGNVGDLYTVAFGTVSTVTGQSAAVIDTSAGAVAAVSASTAMVRILGLYNEPGNEWMASSGAGFTAVECEFINQGLE